MRPSERDEVRATIKDVARRARVSTATVSNVLNGRFGTMRDETLGRVRDAIAELGYVPSGMAKALRTNRSQVVGLVVPSVANPFYAQIARGAEDVALEHGYALFICSSDRLPQRERTYAAVLFERGVDGAIFASSVLDPDHVVELRRRGTPVVLLESEATEPDVDSVLFDNVRAVRIGVEYLAELGHHRIAFATGPLTRHPRRARLEGYRQGLAAHGLTLDPALIVEGPLERETRTGTYELAAGQQIAERLIGLSDPPTAVFAFNDMAALGVMRGLQAAGVRVPEDISVMGLDDITIAELFRPALSTVAQPAYEKGAAAARLVLERLAAIREGRTLAGRMVRFEPRLVIRESTAPPKAERGGDSMHGGYHHGFIAQRGAAESQRGASDPHTGGRSP